MGQYVNDARNERTEHEAGATKGKQGGYGSGEVKCSGQGSSSKSPDFQPAAKVLGDQPWSEMDCPGTNIVKGASAPGYDAPKKGGPNPLNAGGKVQKPKAAEEAGH